MSVWKLELLMAQENWPAAVAALTEMPKSSARNSFLAMTSNWIARSKAGAYSASFIKVFTVRYSEYIEDGGAAIGPNHFANLATLYWRIGDKENANIAAEKGIEAANRHKKGTSEIQINAFKRFAKLVKEGTMPELRELSAWQIKARKEAEAAAKKKSPKADE